jgi:hypothetical protein
MGGCNEKWRTKECQWKRWLVRGDSFHLELPDSKIAKTDERVSACFEEYVRLTRSKNGKPNDKFEEAYEKELKPYIERFAG